MLWAAKRRRVDAGNQLQSGLITPRSLVTEEHVGLRSLAGQTGNFGAQNIGDTLPIPNFMLENPIKSTVNSK